MPQSLSAVFIHVVFSTRNRVPSLDADVRPELHAMLAATVRDTGCDCPRVGGTADHVHLAVRLARTVDVAGLVEAAKVKSSRWIKTRGGTWADFAWQRGYGAFSVSPADVSALVAYIASQDEHHRVRTFQDEYRGFLRRYGVNFEERYVWD